MTLADLSLYLSLFEKDERLTVWHFSLLTAILYLGYLQGQKKVIKASRSKIMSMAHIHTLPTYHKYFKDLQQLGYIKYTPDDKTGYKSEIELLV